jgi:predicted secreted protein
VSLVATGRRNAYPVPAHWPIQSKQNSWRERASAFDDAVVLALKARNTIEDRVDLLETFTNRLMALASTAPNGEAELLQAALQAGGYQLPSSEDEEDYGEAQIVDVKPTR